MEYQQQHCTLYFIVKKSKWETHMTPTVSYCAQTLGELLHPQKATKQQFHSILVVLRSLNSLPVEVKGLNPTPDPTARIARTTQKHHAKNQSCSCRTKNWFKLNVQQL